MSVSNLVSQSTNYKQLGITMTQPRARIAGLVSGKALSSQSREP